MPIQKRLKLPSLAANLSICLHSSPRVNKQKLMFKNIKNNLKRRRVMKTLNQNQRRKKNSLSNSHSLKHRKLNQLLLSLNSLRMA